MKSIKLFKDVLLKALPQGSFNGANGAAKKKVGSENPMDQELTELKDLL